MECESDSEEFPTFPDRIMHRKSDIEDLLTLIARTMHCKSNS